MEERESINIWWKQSQIAGAKDDTVFQKTYVVTPTGQFLLTNHWREHVIGYKNGDADELLPIDLTLVESYQTTRKNELRAMQKRLEALIAAENRSKRILYL